MKEEPNRQEESQEKHFKPFQEVIVVTCCWNIKITNKSYCFHLQNISQMVPIYSIHSISSSRSLLEVIRKLFSIQWWNSSWAISNPKIWCCESAALNMPANLENSAVATGLEKVSFHSNPKERQCQRMLKCEVAQSCSTLCDPMDCSPSGSSVHGILQARILEWVAISFSRGSSQPRDRIQVSRIAGRRFILWATREALRMLKLPHSCTHVSR